MIEPPPTSAPPSLGPLTAPSETDAAAAYPGLRNQALTLAWAAEALGRQAAQLLALARVGELVLIPGPWPMRQADYPGYFVPAWQLQPGARGPYPELAALLAEAAQRGWTSLDLHHFMTTPLDGTTPAALLRTGKVDHVTALIRGEPVLVPAPPPTQRWHRPHRRIAVHAPHGAAGRRHFPRAATRPALTGRRR
jgi:hypothetical protein